MTLLIDEQPIPLLPSLATEVGINAALFLQQLHYRSLISNNIRDGHKWIYKTYEDWTKEFPFWSSHTIRRIIYDLENKGYVISTNQHNYMKIDKTKWYRIDYNKLPESTFESEQTACVEMPHAPVEVKQSSYPKPTPPCSEKEQKEVTKFSKPITKELKEPLNIKTKNIVEMNLDVTQFVIEYLNDKTGKQFKADSTATRKFINGRIKDGYTQEDFIRVIDLKVSQWSNEPGFNVFLRPSTLFSPINFENYVNELVAARKPKRAPLVPPVLKFGNGVEYR